MAVLERKTLIKTISFMAFFVAINIVCTLFATYLPVVGFVLIIVLPLTSATVEANCKDRWFPIYALSTIGLSIVVSLSSIDFTIFYVVPSIFTGYIFGLSLKKGIPGIFAIFFASIIQALLSFFFVKILFLITEVDVLDIFVKILAISDDFLVNTMILVVFFLVAVIQMVLSYIVVKNELKKFGEVNEIKMNSKFWAGISILASAFLGLIFVFVYYPLALMFIGFGFYFLAFLIYDHIATKNTLALLIDGGVILIQLILFAALNKNFVDYKEFSLLLVAPTLIALISILCSFLKKSE